MSVSVTLAKPQLRKQLTASHSQTLRIATEFEPSQATPTQLSPGTNPEA